MELFRDTSSILQLSIPSPSPYCLPVLLLLDAASSLQPNGTNFFLCVRWDFFLPFRSYAAYALVLRIWLSMRSLREQMISSSLCWSRCFSVAISDYKSELCIFVCFSLKCISSFLSIILTPPPFSNLFMATSLSRIYSSISWEGPNFFSPFLLLGLVR